MSKTLIHCEHSSSCGGCPAISLAYDEQLAKKHEFVRRAFSLFTELAQVTIAPVSAPKHIVQYRTRAKLVTGKGGTLGLYRPGTHIVEDIEHCQVLAPVLSEGASVLRSVLRNPPKNLQHNPALKTVADGGALHAVDLRELVQREPPEQLLLTLVLRTDRCSLDEATAACEWLVEQDIARSAAASWHDGQSIQLLGSNAEILAGDPEPRDALVQQKLWQIAAPGAFVQTHRATASAIHDSIVRALAADQRKPLRVLELYAGSGALGLRLASMGARVTCVETYRPAVARIDRAARLQGMSANVEPIAQDAASYALDCVRRGRVFDCIVVNPPRRGIDEKVLGAIAKLLPEQVVYVSCDPETLARDIAELYSYGYRAERAQPFDMIPLSNEVETLVLLSRAIGNAQAPSGGCTILHSTNDFAVIHHALGHHDAVAHCAGTLWSHAQTKAVFRAAPSEELEVIALLCRDDSVLASASITLEFEAWVRGIARDKGKIDRPVLGWSAASTRYKRLAVEGGHSRLRVTTNLGNSETVRAHLAQIGLSILGDERFGDRATNSFCREKLGLRRAAIQMTKLSLSLTDQTPTQEQTWSAPLSGALLLLSSRLLGRSLGTLAKDDVW